VLAGIVGVTVDPTIAAAEVEAGFVVRFGVKRRSGAWTTVKTCQSY
jgi:hypothetical protein